MTLATTSGLWEAIKYNDENVAFENKCKSLFCNFIPDPLVCFVAGGVFPRLYHDMPIRDIDVYCDSEDVYKSFCKEFDNSSEFDMIMVNHRMGRYLHKLSKISIDLINFHNPRGLEYVKNFDFTICRLHYTNNRLYMFSLSDMLDIKNKRLVFTGTSMLGGSHNNILTRMKKYLDLGFKIDDHSLGLIYKYLMSDEARRATDICQVYE